MARRLLMLAKVLAALLALLRGEHRCPRTRQPLDGWPSIARSEASRRVPGSY
jgi:hypothetical protein